MLDIAPLIESHLPYYEGFSTVKRLQYSPIFRAVDQQEIPGRYVLHRSTAIFAAALRCFIMSILYSTAVIIITLLSEEPKFPDVSGAPKFCRQKNLPVPPILK